MENGIKLRVVNDMLEVELPWDATDTREWVKDKLRGRHWDPTRKLWLVPLSEANIRKVLSSESPFAADDALRDTLEAKRAHDTEKQQRSLNLSTACDAAEDLDLPSLSGPLRPFQKAGVRFALLHRGVLWADDQGLGKSVQSIATVEYLNLYPVVIYCPAVVKLNWKAELQKWVPHRRVAVLGVGKRAAGSNPDEADVVVLNYDIAAKHVDVILSRKPKALIADESHYLKNRKAKRTQAIMMVVESLGDHIQKLLLLSGTPVLNRPAELATQLRMLGVLDTWFGGFQAYAYRYCDAYTDRFGFHTEGASHLDELHTKLRKVCMVRRLKQDVLTELPEKTIVPVPVTLANPGEYTRADKAFDAWLHDKLQGDPEFLRSIAHLSPVQQRLAMTRRVEKTLRAETLAHRGALRALAGAGKVPDAIAWIEGFHEANGCEKLLVFAHHVAVQRALLEVFPDGLHILAEDTAEQRQAAVEAFQTDPARWLMVLSTPAAQTGLTLHAASNELFVEYEDTAAAHAQAEDRAHRIGQKNAVTVYRLHAEDTIDDDMRENLESKLEVFDAAITGRIAMGPAAHNARSGGSAGNDGTAPRIISAA